VRNRGIAGIIVQRELSPAEIERARACREPIMSALKDYQKLLMSYNRRINLVSRRHDPNFFDHHILHALALSVRSFATGSSVVDWGSGGGIPAIPLALAFPEVEFICVDKVEKKIRAIRAMAGELGLKNIRAIAARAESMPGNLDYSISRATASLGSLWNWHRRISTRNMDEGVPSPRSMRQEKGESGTFWNTGLLCLKGGDLKKEIGALWKMDDTADVELIDIAGLFIGDYFRDKRIVHVSIQE
jgi:16S rRNA (guanine527-N7)-methyltransferase